jgi:carboxypeptidase D
MLLTNWLAISLASVAAAQYFPPIPEGLKVVNSKHEQGVKISYKEVSG